MSSAYSKPSPAGMAILRNLHAGYSAHYGAIGRRATAGVGVALQSLHRRGLIDSDNQLTAAGRAVLRREET